MDDGTITPLLTLHTACRNKQTTHSSITVHIPNNNKVDSSYIDNYYMILILSTATVGYVVHIFTQHAFFVFQLRKMHYDVVFGNVVSIMKNGATIYTDHFDTNRNLLWIKINQSYAYPNRLSSTTKHASIIYIQENTRTRKTWLHFTIAVFHDHLSQR